MTTKAYSLNVGVLSTILKTNAQLVEQASPKPPATTKTSIFSLGSDPRVGSLQISTPDFFLVEIMKDQLKQLFVRVNWKIPRFDIDSGKTIGFNVYRKRIQTFHDRKLSTNQVAKLSVGLKFNGGFSEDRKGINNIKSGMIDLSVLNPNLAANASMSRAQQLSSLDQANTQIQSRIENFVRKFEKIAFIDYSQFIKNEQLKTVFVTGIDNVSMFYDDKAVGFGEEFEYFVSSVSSNFDETFQSDVIRVLVMDNRGISAPDIFTKQIDAMSINVQISYESKEQIDNVFLYRREVDNDVDFIKIAEFFDVQKDTVEFLDKTSFFGKQFIYRAFTENLHGVDSPAAELTVFSSTNIEKSHSNNLKKPVFQAVQQKNVATLTISPNDPRVLFFRVDRRDLSINEKVFTTPGRDTDGYGGSGWQSNQLFYDRLKQAPIVFVDNTVLGEHIYQYRIVGFDRFGNTTSSSYQTIEILKQDLLKAPINLQIFVLRESPMRFKLIWDDQNVYEKDVVPLFEIQRRQGHNNFASFPLTQDKFLVDEVFSSPVSEITATSGERAPLAPAIPSSPPLSHRSNGVLDFLKENLFYFYRIKIITENGSFSPFSGEAKLVTVQPLANPINLSVLNENPKVKPAVIQLTWDVEENKQKPDHFVIERKVDNVNDVFRPIGKAYFKNELFDRSLVFGKRYVYRIKSVDSLGRETIPVEVRVSI